MSIQFISRLETRLLPTLAMLFFFLFFHPDTGSAQAMRTFSNGHPGHQDMVSSGLVRQLEQNALFTLLGFLTLLGLVWIGYVVKACARLNRRDGNTGRSFLLVLVLTAGMGAFCGSCSETQLARASQINASMYTETQPCTSPYHHSNFVNIPYNNNYSSKGYSNWQGPYYCKYCGQKVYRTGH